MSVNHPLSTSITLYESRSQLQIPSLRLGYTHAGQAFLLENMYEARFTVDSMHRMVLAEVEIRIIECAVKWQCMITLARTFSKFVLTLYSS
jgi:hypothetical protein